MLSQKKGGADYDYLPNPLGNVKRTIATGQSLRQQYLYSPWGESAPVSDDENASTPFQFIGAYGGRTQDVGGVYFRARTYSPTYARWLTVDPLWPEEAAYDYAGNGPTTNTDPFGLGFDCPDPKDVETYRSLVKAYNDLIARMKKLCGSHIREIEACWRKCHDCQPEKEAECFCRHTTQFSRYNVDIICDTLGVCQRLKDSQGNPCRCMCTEKGGRFSNCKIHVCNTEDYSWRCSATENWERDLFHEMFHCCGAVHYWRDPDPHADADCLDLCLLPLGGFPPF